MSTIHYFGLWAAAFLADVTTKAMVVAWAPAFPGFENMHDGVAIVYARNYVELGAAVMRPGTIAVFVAVFAAGAIAGKMGLNHPGDVVTYSLFAIEIGGSSSNLSDLAAGAGVVDFLFVGVGQFGVVANFADVLVILVGMPFLFLSGMRSSQGPTERRIRQSTKND